MGDIVFSELAKDLVINIINIIILFVIVRSLVYKPVRKFLSARTEKIKNMQAEAENKLKEAETARADYQKMLVQSRTKSAEIISAAEQKAKQSSEQIIAAANQNARGIIEKAREAMQQERNQMINSMRDEITKLAFDISARILKRECKDEDNAKIAADFFSQENSQSGELLRQSAERINAQNESASPATAQNQ